MIIIIEWYGQVTILDLTKMVTFSKNAIVYDRRRVKGDYVEHRPSI